MLLAAVTAALVGLQPAAEATPGVPVGRVLHYVRSNQDGSEAERIHIFRRSATRIEVYKAREKCTNAAFVSAELDLPREQARQLTGGRLRPGATHEDFAWLTYDPATRRIDARIELPGGTLRDSAVVAAEPWHLFDFDLASLITLLPARADPTADFSFGLPVVWFDPARGDDFISDLGRANARFVRKEQHSGRAALRFEVGGPALGAKGGPMWIDAADGTLIEARWGLPNHVEYHDFRLVLQGVDDGGSAGWDKLLRAHFDGCPT